MQEVYVDIETHGFAKCQLLTLTILEFDKPIIDLLRFCFPRLLALYNGILGGWDFVHRMHNRTRFIFAELPWAIVFEIYNQV